MQEVNESSWSESCSLLVTPPHCIAEVDDIVAVEGAMLQPVDVGAETSPITLGKDSQFGAEEGDDMTELEDRTGKNPLTYILPNAGPEAAGGFDVCNEYGYNAYDVDDDDDDDGEEPQNERNVAPPLTLSSFVTSSHQDSVALHEQSHKVYLLGTRYDPLHDYEPRRNDETSLFWFTYRFDFPEIVPYRITTDAGWGCMLRSAQMMLGQALRMHYKSRCWRPPQAMAQRRQDRFMVQIMTWFADYPSKTECIFSLHNMVAAGLANYETLPGEWYGPSKASYVMRDLCQLYEEQQVKEQSKCIDGSKQPMFRVHVASQGTVYKDSIENLMTKSQQNENQQNATKSVLSATTVSHPLDPLFSALETKHERKDSKPWDTSLLLLIPVRLGLQNFNQEYSVQLAHMFSFSQSVGVLGGRPRGARWFYGATSDGIKLYGLDPHTIQGCPDRRRTKLPNGQIKSVIALTDEYLRSVHTTHPECINLKGLDPSLALGFFCRDRDDFESFCDSLQRWKKNNPKMPEIFSIANQVPDYAADVSSAMNEMMGMSLSDALGEDDQHESEDEDEYVLL